MLPCDAFPISLIAPSSMSMSLEWLPSSRVIRNSLTTIMVWRCDPSIPLAMGCDPEFVHDGPSEPCPRTLNPLQRNHYDRGRRLGKHPDGYGLQP